MRFRTEVAQASEVDPEMLAELRRLTDEIAPINIDDELPARSVAKSNHRTA